MAATDLPFIDEHCIQIAAPRTRTWIALGEVLGTSFGGMGTAKIAAVLGTRHRSVSGTPLAVGSSIVGFRVTQSQPELEVVLEGEHRFSRYRLTFELHDGSGLLGGVHSSSADPSRYAWCSANHAIRAASMHRSSVNVP